MDDDVVKEKYFLKVRVINLTQGGLKAMEALAKLEAERGTPGYVSGGAGKGDMQRGEKRLGT